MRTTRVSSAVGICLLTMTCLAALGPPVVQADEAAVKKCIADLGNPDAMARLKAAKALGQMGAEAGAAIPALRAVADGDPDEDVRLIAANAIRKIQAGPDPRVSALTAALADDDPFVRMQAAKALGGMGAKATAALPALRALDKDPDEDVRLIAASAVRKIAGTGAAAEPTERPNPPEPPKPVAPAAPEASAKDVEVADVTSIFCHSYKDQTGRIETPSSRFFMVELKNTGRVPLFVAMLTVVLEKAGEITGREAVQGPEPVLLPGRSVYCCFDLPLRKETTRFKIEVERVIPATLEADARERLERQARLQEQMRVIKIRAIERFGVPLGERFTIHNPDSKPVQGVRVVILGYDGDGKLTNLLYYYSEEVAPGFSDFENNPTNEDEPRKGNFEFDGVADAKRDVFPKSYRGMVVGVGVRKYED